MRSLPSTCISVMAVLGRPRLKGDRRPTLEAVLADEDTPWSKLTMERWYGDAPREVEVATNSAVWYHSGKPPVLLRWVLIRDPHKGFEPQALWSTNLDYTPEQMLTSFIRRWTIEVTLEEARAHLGLESQRQWNTRAIARTTPALLSLYSIVTLTAHQLLQKEAAFVQVTAWYAKIHPTFADAIALVQGGKELVKRARHAYDTKHEAMLPEPMVNGRLHTLASHGPRRPLLPPLSRPSRYFPQKSQSRQVPSNSVPAYVVSCMRLK